MTHNERRALDMALRILNDLKASRGDAPDVPVPPDSDYWKVLEQLRGRLEMIEAENKELRTKLERARRFYAVRTCDDDMEWMDLITSTLNEE